MLQCRDHSTLKCRVTGLQLPDRLPRPFAHYTHRHDQGRSHLQSVEKNERECPKWFHRADLFTSVGCFSSSITRISHPDSLRHDGRRQYRQSSTLRGEAAPKNCVCLCPFSRCTCLRARARVRRTTNLCAKGVIILTSESPSADFDAPVEGKSTNSDVPTHRRSKPHAWVSPASQNHSCSELHQRVLFSWMIERHHRKPALTRVAMVAADAIFESGKIINMLHHFEAAWRYGGQLNEWRGRVGERRGRCSRCIRLSVHPGGCVIVGRFSEVGIPHVSAPCVVGGSGAGNQDSSGSGRLAARLENVIRVTRTMLRARSRRALACPGLNRAR